MEEKPFNNSNFHLIPKECILQMDQTLMANVKADQAEVCYSNEHDLNTKTIEKNALDSYIDNSLPVSNHSKISAAKLSDLLDLPRKQSLYSDNIIDPASIKQDVDRYIFYSTELGAIKSSNFKDLLLTKPADQQTISDLLLNTTSWWIDIFAPTNNEMQIIAKIFKIHPLTTEDIQAQESREKCEILNHYMFISFKSFTHDLNDPYKLKSSVFYILVFKDGVLTFRFEDLPHPHNVRKRIHQLKDFIKVTPKWINYALIDNITDHFAPLIQVTDIEADSIDDLVLVLNGSEQSDMLRRIGACRSIVMQLSRLLSTKADVVKSLINRYKDKAHTIKEYQDENKLQNDVTLYLGDIQDHILTMLQSVNHADLVLGRAHQNYLGQISIELTQAGNTTNAVVNRLTYFATIVVPMNLVCGLFGMNVKIPGSSHTDFAWFYWIVLGMLVYAVFMLSVGRRQGFI